MEKEKQKIKMMLHPNEVFVIERWRNKYKFGDMTIRIHEGIPQFIEKVKIKEYSPK